MTPTYPGSTSRGPYHKTGFIEPARIERGEVPGWVELSTNKEIAIKVMFEMDYVDSLPESVEDMIRKDATR